MRLAFLGTSDFAVPALGALVEAGHEVLAVYTRAPKPAGRGQQERRTPVHERALSLGLPVRTPRSLKSEDEARAFKALDLDAAVVVSYGHILTKAFLDAPVLGCINIHGSLLPRWRGAAPIQRAIMAGDAETGVSIMEMTEEMDAGDVLLVRRTPIEPDDTTGTLGERLAALGAAAIGEAIDGLHAGTLHAQPQPPEGVTFAPKIEREQARLDWTRPAAELERVVRAMQPAPAAFTTLDGRLLKVHRAALAPASHGSPGSVLAAGIAGIDVATGDGALRLVEVQLEGKKRMAAAPFVAGHPLPPGTRLG
jgi:methionyl-tRNA formyltransferase